MTAKGRNQDQPEGQGLNRGTHSGGDQSIAPEGEVVVSVKNVSKKFCKNLRRSMAYGVMDLASNFLGIKPDSSTLRKDEFWALKNSNFELRRGESLGLIGVNGSGKTTLLRLIAGLFPPDRGEIIVRGRVGALISVGAGFHPHMSGRENIYLNGSILGLKSREIAEQFDDIVNFADLGQFIDSPVSTYSTGMRVRLGFSIATAFKPDVLLIDEILAVGDAIFRRRCFDRLKSISDMAAVVFVSHQMRHVEQFCERAIYLEDGRVIADGNVIEVTKQYLAEVNKVSGRFFTNLELPRQGTHELVFTDTVTVRGEQSGNNKLSHIGENLIVEAEFLCEKPMNGIRFRVGIEDLSTGALITAANCTVPTVSTGGKVRCVFKDLTLRPRTYTILLAIADLKQVIDLWRHAAHLVVEGGFSERVQYSITDRELTYLPHEIAVEVAEQRYSHSHEPYRCKKVITHQ